MQNDFRWDDLRVVLALFRERSLSAAALRLGVNPSTIGRRIDALEEALGTALFDRGPDGAVATAAAEELVPIAESIERATAEVARLVEGYEAEPEGLVRVTAPPGLVDYFLAPMVPRLARQYPRIRLVLDASVGYADLGRHEADIALRGLRPERGDLVARKILTATSVIVASRRYLQRVGEVSRLADLAWVTWADDLAHIPDARWLRSQVPAESIALYTSSMNAQILAVRAGAGAMLMARPFARVAGLREVTLAPALVRSLEPLPSGELWLVGHRATRDVPRVAAVWQFLLDELGRVTAG
jgi:DNA-binding transcriptional LysR family regulator